MNVFAYPLIKWEVDPEPDRTPTKLVIDDNIGEAIHIHLRNFRLDMSVEDFETFADGMQEARQELNEVRQEVDDGNR